MVFNATFNNISATLYILGSVLLVEETGALGENDKESYTNFYLSMVYALNGNGDESFKMHRKFRAT
jgi:hypothetical protein